VNIANVAGALQIITAALQLIPVGAATAAKIRELLGQDPNVAGALDAILAGTITTDDAAIAMARAWRSGVAG
jgi:hypothetical protein